MTTKTRNDSNINRTSFFSDFSVNSLYNNESFLRKSKNIPKLKYVQDFLLKNKIITFVLNEKNVVHKRNKILKNHVIV